jgi:hypothetical protein
MGNGHQVNTLFDISIMGENFISGKFVSTNRIATENFEVPIFLKMGVKGSRSTINYKGKPVIQIHTESDEITKVLVLSIENYDIFLEMPYLNCHQAAIDCEKATIMFLKTGYVL